MRPQIGSVQGFLRGEEISTTGISHERHPSKRDAYRIDVGAVGSVLRAAKSMLPYCSKKAEDLRLLIDYLEDKITGSQAIERLNEEVIIGRRSGYFREPNLPYTRAEGLRRAQLENARNARAAHAVNVGKDTQESIRRDHKENKIGHIRLAKKYGYSVSVIRRVLGKC